MTDKPWIRLVRINDEPWWAISLPRAAMDRVAGAFGRLFRPARRPGG